MERFLETIINGIATGSIYGALALALVLIFRSTGIVNFAQGEMAMFATFIAWAMTQAGIPIGLAVLATLVVAFVAGMLIERVLIRPVEGGQVQTASPFSRKRRPSVTSPTVRCGARSTGRIATRSTTTPPANAMTSGAANAPQ